MYKAELYKLTKDKWGKYKVYVLVDYHGVEECAEFRFDKLVDIPRYLLAIKGGKVQYRKGKTCYVSHPIPGMSDDGMVFEFIHEKNEACECD